MSNKKHKSIRVIVAIAEHLVKNPNCASYYSLKWFKIIQNCYNIFDLI